MALYPTLSEVPYISIEGAPEQKILKSNFDDLGKEQRKRKWLYPKRNFVLNYNNITNVDIVELQQFWIDRSGSFYAFTFIFDYSSTYASEYVGTGDGSTTIFNLPSKGASATTVYGNASPYSPGDTTSGDYYIIENGGTDGVDSLIFRAAIAAGDRITYDFTGRLAIRCTFKDTIKTMQNHGSFQKNSAMVELNGLLMDE